MLAGQRKLAVIMRKPEFEELEYHETPLGELILRWRTIPSMNHREVFEVKLDGAFLMSSLNTATEEALANLPLEQIKSDHLDILIGGLGLGYTAQAALKHDNVRSVTILELLPQVIGWHEKELVPLGEMLTQHERVNIVQGDFFRWALGQDKPPGMLDTYDVILVDIDHSPEFLLSKSHQVFYQASGLQCLKEKLNPKGLFALWSADPPQESFVQQLQQVFDQVTTHDVVFYNPLFNQEDANTIYISA